MSVVLTYALGVGLTVLLMVAWVAVQGAWRRAFPEPIGPAAEPDVLAARGGGCGNCTCTTVCSREPPSPTEELP